MAAKRENKAKRTPRERNSAAYWDTPLHSFLLPKLSKIDGLVRGGRIDTMALSQRAGVARYTVYRWFQADHISARAARLLRELSRPEKDAEPLIAKDEIARFTNI